MPVLSDTLVKEFAKATNDTEKEVKNESYVYGTAHVNNGTIQVQFDGSELLTPCSSTVEVKDGDRVMVMIKSRSAVITSNITTPSIHYTIGGLDISEDAIKWNGSFADKDYEVGLYKNQGAVTDKFIAMNVGGDYVTYIRYDGYLYSKNAYIEGELHADRGEFTGNVRFAGGYVGGLRISPTSIYWEDTISGVKYTSGLYKGTNSATDQFWSVKKGDTDLAYLRYDGYLYAENANIKGTIHADNGEINGSLKITGGTIGGLRVDANSVSWTNQIEGTNYKAGIYKGTALASYFLDINVGGNHRTYLRYDGYFYAQNAEIAGKITSTEGSIGGFTIGQTSISWTNKSNNVNYVCGLYKGNNTANNKFLRITKAGTDVLYMTYEGFLYANGVQIGGKLSTESGSSIGGMAADNNKLGWISGTTWGFIRKYENSDTKFIDVQVRGIPQTYLTYGGKFYSQNAEIVGKITATSGEFTGTVNAAEGTVGGFTIGETSISWTDTISNVKYVCGLYKGNNKASDKFLRITKAGTDVAYMQYDGKLYATSVDVKGKLSTEAGSAIGGMATDANKIGWESGNNYGYIRKYTSTATKFIDVRSGGVDTTYLTYGGKFYSQNAEITGDITATTITALDHYYMQRIITVTSGASSSGGTSSGGGTNYDVIHGSSGSGSTGMSTYTVTKKAEALGFYNDDNRAALHVGSEFDVISIGQPTWDYDMYTSTSISMGGIVTIVHQSNSNCFTAYGCATFRGDNVRITGDLEVEGDYPGASDVRLKENIKDTEENALPIINAIRMRQFDWKKDHSHQTLGMVADEIEKLDPRLVKGGGYFKSGTMHIKKIDVWHLANYLTKAVQELSSKVEELERRLENGESK